MSIAGELVTETFEYDGGRQVTVYVPPDPPEAVVFAGDGQLISQWGGVLEAADVPSTMIVGVHRLADETLRLHEYSPGFDPERFAAHERFFVEDVRRWARSRFGVALPAERTAVFGVSAGGELALAIGLRHPDVYGAVFCASPGAGYRPPGVMPSLASARVPRRRHAGAVLPRERDPVGGGAARCRCGRRHDRAGRIARRRVLARRVPADGGVGVWTMKHRDVVRRSRPPVPLTRARVEGTLRRVRARLRQGQQSQDPPPLNQTQRVANSGQGWLQGPRGSSGAP